ncbi:MAG: cytochrome c [Polyangiaceae bacterium]|nr:cytochrome c [Polyangiaceae bacterium]MCE7889726.1 cytochrome c [Sorangiineae bacterium PRO1]MCL4755611.1 c-type cytochrome [Myxococcales bacterium]
MKPSTVWRALSIGAAVAVVLGATDARASGGEQKFNSVCAACHTIGGGTRVGPDLKGVADRRSEEWLLQFIKSSQSVIASGDPVAVKLFNDFNKTPMPDMPQFSEADIKDIIDFIRAGGSGSGGGMGESFPEATSAEIDRGRRLFQGLIRLENAGPACNSCHHVTHDAVIGGGVLAKDLTQVFSRVGAPGVSAILGKPPFPVMEAAYKDAPLTQSEARDIVGFLQDVDKTQALQTPVDYGNRLVAGGSAMFVVLAGLYGVIWRRRKPGPVNREIFERQVKSE